MSRNALDALARLRRFEVNTAQRDLATKLHAVADAEQVQRVSAMAIARETAATTTQMADVLVVEAFCHWQPHGQAVADATRAARGVADRGADRARAILAMAHAAAEAVEVLRAGQARAKRAAVLCAEQAALDELAARG